MSSIILYACSIIKYTLFKTTTLYMRIFQINVHKCLKIGSKAYEFDVQFNSNLLMGLNVVMKV